MKTRFSMQARFPIKTWNLWLRLMGYAPGKLAAMLALVFLRMAIQFAPALLIRRMFEALPRSGGFISGGFISGGFVSGGLSPDLWLLVALLVATALAQVAIFVSATWVESNFRELVGALLRQNMVEAIYQRPAAVALPVPVGDVVSRLGVGIPQTTRPLIAVLVQSLNAVTVVIAVWIMGRTNLPLAAAALAPLLVAAVASHRASARMAQLRRSSLAAEGHIGTFLREIFGAVQMVQVAGTETRAAERFIQLNEARRKRVLQESLFQDVLMNSLLQNVSYFSTGLLLLLSWRYMLEGSFTISDFALFTYFLPIISDFAMQVGQSFAAYKQSEAAFERLSEAAIGLPAAVELPAAIDLPGVEAGQAQNLVRYQPVYLSGPIPDIPQPEPPGPADVLESLEISGLTCLHNGSDRGIRNVSLRLEGGSFTAVTGRVGSGKTTLLRALLGLLPLPARQESREARQESREARQEPGEVRREAPGEIRWNGQRVHDPASFFVPPRAAYVRQAPGLFSATLRENILLGLPDQPGLTGYRLERAVKAAVLELDLPMLENGLDTQVGPRGVKLSGGQIQRAAAARALARPASLLVLDDLSSALDVETEQRLWTRLKSLGVTLLVVTHRREALKQADKVIVMKDGRVEAAGTLEKLLESCQEMKELWAGELS